ncbi:MAG: D-aminoacylase, partial [Planctomycetaceae bacterium]
MTHNTKWTYAILMACCGFSQLAHGQELDLIISGPRVVDGTGAPWYRADIGIRQGRIAAIGRLRGRPARRTIEASKFVLSPGFL